MQRQFRHFVTLNLAAAILILIHLPQALASNSAPGIQPLDGVNVEAVQTYQNPKSSLIDFGLGIWPLNPYYNGFSLDVGYTRYFNKSFSWEILHGDYIYTVDSGLTSTLAQNYNVNPIQIERLNYSISSNLQYVLAYGKFVFFKEYIRYFRSAALIGPAFLSTNKEAAVGLGMGWRYEVFVNQDFSWKAEVRDIYSFGNVGNNLAFVFGTAYGF